MQAWAKKKLQPNGKYVYPNSLIPHTMAHQIHVFKSR